MKEVGYTPIRALSVGGRYGDLRDDWELLSPRERHWIDFIPWLIAFPAAVLLFCTLFMGGSAVHVNARTEHLIYTPLYSDPPVWLLKDARIESFTVSDNELFKDNSDKPGHKNNNGYTPQVHTYKSGEQTISLVNGFLQMNCGDRITVSRIGKGEIKVNLNTVGPPTITDDVGNAIQFDTALPNSMTIYPHAVNQSQYETNKGDLEKTVKQNLAFNSYVWPMEGQIIPSRAVAVDTVDALGLMLEGRVDLFNRRVVANSNYLVASHDLELGDHVVLGSAAAIESKREAILQEWAAQDHDPTSSESLRKPWKPKNCEDLQHNPNFFHERFVDNNTADKGFVHIDEEKGMAVSLSSNAKIASIKRYRSSAIGLESSLIKRIQKDHMFTIMWSFILFLFYAYRKLARAYIMSRGRQEAQIAAEKEPQIWKLQRRSPRQTRRPY